MEQALAALGDSLPLHAEEGTQRESIPETDLAAYLSGHADNPAVANTFVAVVRRLYEALGLLDPAELARGRWAFISFPASLLARSVLESLATPGQTFFEPGYWIQGRHRPEAVIEEQRSLLRRLESRRLSSHPTGDPRPIRTVHVAWGLIRLGGLFLLRAREDRRRPEVQGYVFPGGRLDLTDLPRAQRTSEAFRDLARMDSPLVAASLSRTLMRELHEELLLEPRDFEATRLMTLAPFKKLEGTGNNHAYTMYNIAVDHVRLTAAGELKALDHVASEPNNWAWFTEAELAAGKRADGKSAFVDSLAAHHGDDLERYLSLEVADSSSNPPALQTENDAIQLPSRPDQPLIRGMAGRERPVSMALSEQEWELLMVLGWQARGLALDLVPTMARRLGSSWIQLLSRKLLALAQGLSSRFAAVNLPLLDLDSQGHCRLGVRADNVYFHPECFEYSWNAEGPKKSLILVLKGLETSWTTLAEVRLNIPLAPQFSRDLFTAESGQEVSDSFEREARRHFERAKCIGLRRFVSVDKYGVAILVPADKS